MSEPGGGRGAASAYEAREAELGRPDAVVVAERAAFLAQDHGAQVAHARVIRAHAAAPRHALQKKYSGGPMIKILYKCTIFIVT